jgi:hypothetical protein
LPETNIQNAISLRVEDRAKAWPAIQGCYAAQLSDAALNWLVNGGVITHEQSGDAATILRNISDWLDKDLQAIDARPDISGTVQENAKSLEGHTGSDLIQPLHLVFYTTWCSGSRTSQ